MTSRSEFEAGANVVVGLLLVGVWSAWPGVAAAQNAGIAKSLEERVAVLEKGVQMGTVVAGADGFALGSADGDFELKLRGYVQADARFFFNDDAEKLPDTFLLRRVRPVLDGKVGAHWGFRVMPDFGGGKSEIVDAYIDFTSNPSFQVRGGKFKPPFGLERLQSGADLRFAERAYPTTLAPNRDIGLQLSGAPWTGIRYAFGVFNGVADGGSGDVDGEDGKDLVGRLWLEPFKATGSAPLKGLGLGLAGSVGDVQGTASGAGLSPFKSMDQATIFSFRSSATNAADTAFADGARVRVSPQLAWYWGPFGLLGEYGQSSHEVRRGENRATLDHEAWQVAAAWVLTGEDNRFKRIEPERPFDPAQGRWGAVEVVGRFTALDVDDQAFPVYADPAKSVTAVESVGAGINWYLTQHVRAALDYEQSTFDGGDVGGDLPDRHALIARWQMDF